MNSQNSKMIFEDYLEEFQTVKSGNERKSRYQCIIKNLCYRGNGLYDWAIPPIEDILILGRDMISLMKDMPERIQNNVGNASRKIIIRLSSHESCSEPSRKCVKAKRHADGSVTRKAKRYTGKKD